MTFYDIPNNYKARRSEFALETRPQTSRFNFRQSKQSSIYVFGVFVDSRGRETPVRFFDIFNITQEGGLI